MTLNDMKIGDIVLVKTNSGAVFGKICERGKIQRYGVGEAQFLCVSINENTTVTIFEDDILEVISYIPNFNDNNDIKKMNKKYGVKTYDFTNKNELDVFGWVAHYSEIWNQLQENEQDKIVAALVSLISEKDMKNIMELISNLKSTQKVIIEGNDILRKKSNASEALILQMKAITANGIRMIENTARKSVQAVKDIDDALTDLRMATDLKMVTGDDDKDA